MFDNLIARFKLRTLLFNYSEEEYVSAIFKSVLAEKWKSIEAERYYITITTVSGRKLIFWNNNKYYAWASDGRFIAGEKGTSWTDARPSISLLYQMIKRINQEVINTINTMPNGDRVDKYA